MTVYLDTSALAKLVVAEAETTALRQWLAARPDVPRVTNVIGTVELQRLGARVSQEALGNAVRLLSRLDRLALTSSAITLAATLPPATVRSLDALHVASAAGLTDLTALITYDHRMEQTATGYGLPVVTPT